MERTVSSKKSNKKFLYSTIVENFKRQIDDRELLPGDRLPSIAELAINYNVSSITIRSAISELGKMGYVISRPRTGIFVSVDNAIQPRAPRRPSTERVHLSGSAYAQTLAGVMIGLIAVAPPPDPLDLNRWAHFNQSRISVLRGAEQTIGEAGGTARFVGIDDWTRIHAELRTAIKSHLDAGASAVIVIDIHNHPGLADEVMAFVESSDFPLIYVSSGKTCSPPFHVYCDNKATGLMAGTHLLRQGYRDIVFIGPLDNIWVDERCEGVAKAVEIAGNTGQFREIPDKSDRLFDDPVHLYNGVAKMRLIEATLSRLTGWPGIAAANDDAAMMIYDIQKGKGLTLGLDYGLIGVDDEPQVRSLGISSMFPPFNELGHQAVQLASQVLHGRISNADVRLPPVLFPRESTLARPHSSILSE